MSLAISLMISMGQNSRSRTFVQSGHDTIPLRVLYWASLVSWHFTREPVKKKMDGSILIWGVVHEHCACRIINANALLPEMYHGHHSNTLTL